MFTGFTCIEEIVTKKLSVTKCPPTYKFLLIKVSDQCNDKVVELLLIYLCYI